MAFWDRNVFGTFGTFEKRASGLYVDIRCTVSVHTVRIVVQKFQNLSFPDCLSLLYFTIVAHTNFRGGKYQVHFRNCAYYVTLSDRDFDRRVWIE